MGSRLEIRRVSKRFGDHVVLDGVDLSVGPGEIVGLLGQNGAGKSTLAAIATGRLRPDAGVVSVDRLDITDHRAAVAGVIGSAPQRLGIYPTLTVQENLRCFARLYGLRGRALRERCDRVIHSLGLEASAHVRGEHLSGGQARRLHLGMALTHRPGVLLLDEPTVGADVESRQQILGLVRRVADDGAAVIYTTHYLNEIEQLDARIALLQGGALRELGTTAEVIEAWGGGALRVRLESDDIAPEGWVRTGPWLVSHSRRNPGEVLADLITTLGSRAGEIRDVSLTSSTLESAYVRLVRDGASAEQSSEVSRAAA